MRSRRWLPMCALSFCFSIVCGVARAEPPMWAVSSPYAKIYLFGTIHVLPSDLTWDTKRLDETLRKTREIWLEISDQALVGDLPTAFRHLGFDPNENLKSKISAQEYEKLAELPAARMDGVQGKGVDQMRPWFATMAYQNRRGLHGRLVPGVDVAIMRKASASGTPLYGLETPEQQLSAFSNVPEEKALRSLHEALEGKHGDPTMIDRLCAAWAAGDMASVEPIVDKMRETDADQYSAVLVSRNRHWADRLAPRISGGGNALVAVGLAHLIGPDSLPNLLRAKGFRVERLDAGK